MTTDTTATATLFEPVQLGAIPLDNRIAMAPLTRLRSGADGVPGPDVVEYYRQRAGVGLIVAEGTWPVREGRAWHGQPGIETDAQIAGWSRVTEAVHDQGGRIVLQLMHAGRASHPELTGSARTVGPSAVPDPAPVRLADGKVTSPVPHALTGSEVQEVIDGFVRAARHAMAAGFDGVQVHGANGYLVHQFLSPAVNHRTDGYGGSPLARARFAVEVTAAVADAVGPERTALRLSPSSPAHGMGEGDPLSTAETYLTLAETLAPPGLAFVDVLYEDPTAPLVQEIRRTMGAPLVLNTGFASPTTREEAQWLLESGLTDVVGVGRALLANPDLVERWRTRAPENRPDPSTFYSGGAAGYVDYPSLQIV